MKKYTKLNEFDSKESFISTTENDVINKLYAASTSQQPYLGEATMKSHEHTLLDTAHYLNKLKEKLVEGTNRVLIEFLTVNMVTIIRKFLFEMLISNLKNKVAKENLKIDVDSAEALRDTKFLNSLHKTIVSSIDSIEYINRFRSESDRLAQR